MRPQPSEANAAGRRLKQSALRVTVTWSLASPSLLLLRLPRRGRTLAAGEGRRGRGGGTCVLRQGHRCGRLQRGMRSVGRTEERVMTKPD
jgi:hypothetical protein